MNWHRYWKRNKAEIIRWAIVVGAALIVSILVVVLSNILDRPMDVYYPHDEHRRQQVSPVLPAPQYYFIRTCEDEHKQTLE